MRLPLSRQTAKSPLTRRRDPSACSSLAKSAYQMSSMAPMETDGAPKAELVAEVDALKAQLAQLEVGVASYEYSEAALLQPSTALH